MLNGCFKNNFHQFSGELVYRACLTSLLEVELWLWFLSYYCLLADYTALLQQEITDAHHLLMEPTRTPGSQYFMWNPEYSLFYSWNHYRDLVH